MTPYADVSGTSGIVAYEATPDAIIIRFVGGARYEYNEQKPGPAAVARMKALAANGRGLATYISRFVRESYFRKL
jgi:hypothetical protein